VDFAAENEQLKDELTARDAELADLASRSTVRSREKPRCIRVPAGIVFEESASKQPDRKWR
jgi:hypothetical protein